jgi:hypothetical protein
MKRAEFEQRWARLLASLPAEDREMVEAVLLGAEVNHTMAYILVSAFLGLLSGYLLAAWVGVC